jgi:hypothetical protein
MYKIVKDGNVLESYVERDTDVLVIWCPEEYCTAPMLFVEKKVAYNVAEYLNADVMEV